MYKYRHVHAYVYGIYIYICLCVFIHLLIDAHVNYIKYLSIIKLMFNHYLMKNRLAI